MTRRSVHVNLTALAACAIAVAAPACGSSASPTAEVPVDGGAAPPSDDASPDAPHVAPPSLMHLALRGCTPYRTARMTFGGSQTFDLIIDTGSTTTAVASKACKTCDGVSPLYEPGPQAVDRDRRENAAYNVGDITWSGEAYEDTLAPEGAPAAAVSLAFAAIDDQKSFLVGAVCGDGSPSQGILGLGPKAIALPGTDAYLDKLAGLGVPDVVSFELCDTGGNMWLGGFDPAFTTAPPKYTPLITGAQLSALYSIDVADLEVGGATIGAPADSFGPAFIDTGGPMFAVPGDVFTALTKSIAASPGFQSLVGKDDAWFASADKCTKIAATRDAIDAALPKLTLSLGADHVLVDFAPTSSYLVTYDDGATWCPGVVTDPGFPQAPYKFDIGGALLRGNVVIFDRGAKRVGFAPHVPCK